MLHTDHCFFCDNKITDFKRGALCNLTNKKPDFSKKCNVIKLDKTFEEKIKDINIEYETAQRTKTDAFGLAIFYFLIAFAFFGGGFYLSKYILESYVISTVPLIIMAVGIAPLGMSVGRINAYRTSKQIARQKKDRLDTIAKMYGYDYDINIEHLKDSLGNVSHNIDLKIRRTNSAVL